MLFPGSCSGAMEAVIWSFLGNKTVTALIFDYWGVSWYEDLLKLNLEVDLRKNLEGDLPDLNNIPKNNDIIINNSNDYIISSIRTPKRCF